MDFLLFLSCLLKTFPEAPGIKSSGPFQDAGLKAMQAT